MDAPDPRIILVFARAPVLGKVKTRLATQLEDRVVLQLYRCLILDLLETLDGLKLPIVICHTPADAGPLFRRWLPDRYGLMPQKGAHLGQRMAAAFQDVFAMGYRQAVLIGSDLPDLPGDYVSQAFSDLHTVDAVIGPTADGGYYLIGFRGETYCPALFETLAWGTPQVLTETLAIAKTENLHITLLPGWMDIDDPADVAAFLLRNQPSGSAAPRTRAYLEELKSIYNFD